MAAKTTKSKNILFIVAYVLGWLTGIIVYITAGQTDKRLKFHAVQAIFLGIVTTIIGWIPVIGIVGLLLWIYGLYIGWKAYDSGDDIEIPVIGPYARQYSK